MQALFRDRREAGRRLAEDVSDVVGREDGLVLGLPRGGVAVAYEIACALGLPLDVLVMRRLKVPGSGSLMVGSIAAGGVRVLDSGTIAKLGIPLGAIDDLARREAIELARLERYYRGRRQSPKMMGRTIVLVDDGLSPKLDVRAGLEALLAYRPVRIVAAIPGLGSELASDVRKHGALAIGAPSFVAPGPTVTLYEDASTLSDRDVRQLLARAEAREQHQLLTG
jgi:predicted phosphoribosyltransferase